MCHQNASVLSLECQSTPGMEVNWSVIVIYFHSSVHSAWTPLHYLKTICEPMQHSLYSLIISFEVSKDRLKTEGPKNGGSTARLGICETVVICLCLMLCQTGHQRIRIVRGRFNFGRCSSTCQTSLAKETASTTWLGLSWHPSSLCSALPAIWY